jgi:hypothetical protein
MKKIGYLPGVLCSEAVRTRVDAGSRGMLGEDDVSLSLPVDSANSVAVSSALTLERRTNERHESVSLSPPCPTIEETLSLLHS